MSIISKCQTKLEQLSANGNLRSLKVITADGNYAFFNEHRLLNLSSNDYLSLATNQSLHDQFILQYNALSFTSSSSRLLCGNSSYHEVFEQKLATLYNKEALAFNSGYHMNLGIISALSTKSTLILADKLIHASLIDGIKLTPAKFMRFAHNDLTHLASLIDKYHSQYEDIIIVVESIYSMDGDLCDLKQLVNLKQSYDNIFLYVDEAHAFGVRGTKGLGLCEELNLIDDIDIIAATCGKALASTGAFCICDKIIKDYLINCMRPLIFSTALAPINMAHNTFMLDQIVNMQAQREHLTMLACELKACIEQKFDKCPSNSQIIPLMAYSNEKALKLYHYFLNNGCLAMPIRSPTVAKGSERLRFSLCAGLSVEQLHMLKGLINAL